MDIDELEAGRELDEVVAEKVMGWQLVHTAEPLAPFNRWRDRSGKSRYTRNDILPGLCWLPSTNIAAAWEVVGALNGMKLGWFSLEQFGEKGQGTWRAIIWTGGEEMDDCLFADAETVPLAICRMALKAVTKGEVV